MVTASDYFLSLSLFESIKNCSYSNYLTKLYFPLIIYNPLRVISLEIYLFYVIILCFYYFNYFILCSNSYFEVYLRFSHRDYSFYISCLSKRIMLWAFYASLSRMKYISLISCFFFTRSFITGLSMTYFSKMTTVSSLNCLSKSLSWPCSFSMLLVSVYGY